VEHFVTSILSNYATSNQSPPTVPSSEHLSLLPTDSSPSALDSAQHNGGKLK